MANFEKLKGNLSLLEWALESRSLEEKREHAMEAAELYRKIKYFMTKYPNAVQVDLCVALLNTAADELFGVVFEAAIEEATACLST